MPDELRCDEQGSPNREARGRRARAGGARRSFGTVLRRSAQCLRIAPEQKSHGGAPTHRIIFTYANGDEMPDAARRMTRAFGLGLALVLSVRTARYLCRVFAVGGTHDAGSTSLHFTVSLREFPADSVRWRNRPASRRLRIPSAPVGVTLPLPI